MNISVGEARDFRVGQIPNGKQFQCIACHTSPGGPRNNFGKDIGSKYLDMSGNVKWGPELAKLDSDGDGFTNGEELGDPEGTWKIGDPDPVVMSGIYNPGDANSKPNVGFVINSDNIPSDADVSLFTVNPSTIYDLAEILINVRNENYFKIDMFDLFGKKIASIMNDYKMPGEYRILFDINDFDKSQFNSGFYILRLSYNSNAIIRKIFILK